MIFGGKCLFSISLSGVVLGLSLGVAGTPIWSQVAQLVGDVDNNGVVDVVDYNAVVKTMVGKWQLKRR